MEISTNNNNTTYGSENHFWNLGLKLILHARNRSENVGKRRFRAFFGCTPLVCSIIWNKIQIRNLPNNAEPDHLLWTLLFLKLYDTEHCNRGIIKADEKTIRKWVWIFINLIANLDVVKWENRFQNADRNSFYFTSIDGTDFRINQPQPYNTKWYSHKFHGPGLRYEVAICLQTGYIVWANGSYPCGLWPDINIARHRFVHKLGVNEMVVADRGYRDTRFFILPNEENSEWHNRVMSRHETVNRRFKQFNVLNRTFRHKINLHHKCFFAVLNITQLEMENGSPLFSI